MSRDLATYIDHIFYINLAKRTDRRAEIETVIAEYGITAERFDAIEDSPGIVGCTRSHQAVLMLARERGYKNVLILEDDFIFTVSRVEFHAFMLSFFETNIPYDVLMLSYHIKNGNSVNVPLSPLIRRVKSATLASGYLVNGHYYDALIKLYEWAIPLLKSTGQHWHYANDQCWKQLQNKDIWYCCSEKMGIQRDGYSDNSGVVIKHFNG